MGGTAVKYYVVLPDGQRFGPADISLLNQWAAEGRILPQTMLEEEGSMTRMPASSVPGLALATANPYGVPSATQPGGPQQFGGYYRGPQTDVGQSDVTLAWVLGAISMALCVFANCIPFLGLGLGIAAVVFANRAIQKGNPSGQSARIFAWVALGLQILGTGLWLLLMVVSFSGSG